MLHNICRGYVTQVSEPWPVGLLFVFSPILELFPFLENNIEISLARYLKKCLS